jgi:hypothetical protein
MKQPQYIDIKESLHYFFKFPDWKKRTAIVGSIALIGIILYFVAFVLFFIPFIGLLIVCGMFLFIIVFYILYNLYLKGYTYAVVKAVAENKDPSLIPFLGNYKYRITHGFRLFVGNLVYSVPTILLYIFGYTMMIVPMFLLGGTEKTNSQTQNSDSPMGIIIIILMFIGYIPLMVGVLLQMINQYFVSPVIICQYYGKETIKSMLQFKEVWLFIKKNAANLLLYAAILWGIGMVFGIALMFSYFLVFVCIGIIVLPVIMAIGSTLIIHIQAHLIGQICRMSKESQK